MKRFTVTVVTSDDRGVRLDSTTMWARGEAAARRQVVVLVAALRAEGSRVESIELVEG